MSLRKRFIQRKNEKETEFVRCTKISSSSLSPQCCTGMQPCEYFLAHFQSCVILGALFYKQEIHVRYFSEEPQLISSAKIMQRISSSLSLHFLSRLQRELLQLKVNYCKIMGEQLRIQQKIQKIRFSKIIQIFFVQIWSHFTQLSFIRLFWAECMMIS